MSGQGGREQAGHGPAGCNGDARVAIRPRAEPPGTDGGARGPLGAACPSLDSAAPIGPVRVNTGAGRLRPRSCGTRQCSLNAAAYTCGQLKWDMLRRPSATCSPWKPGTRRWCTTNILFPVCARSHGSTTSPRAACNVGCVKHHAQGAVDGSKRSSVKCLLASAPRSPRTRCKPWNPYVERWRRDVGSGCLFAV